MAKIKMDDDALRLDAANLKKKIEEFQNLASQLEDILNEISSRWSGKASESYIQKMREQQSKITKIQTVTEEYKGYVDDALNEMTTLDNDMATKILRSF